jgi:hypothetical protein
MIMNLGKLWITNVVTGDTFGYLTDPARTQSYAVAGAIRIYAAGRRRAIGSAGVSGTWSLTLVELVLTDVAQLKTWLDNGITVLVRDHRGQSFYGTFFQVDVAERIGAGATAIYTAAIAFQAVDVVEGV